MGMLANLLLVSTLAVAPPCSLPADESRRQLQLPYEAFDSRPPPHGWRALLAAGCTDAAVTLLAAYEERNAARLLEPQRLEIAFHQGQVLAMSGRDAEALPHFERAQGGTSDEWAAYVGATVAFLRHEPGKLQAARDAYARIAPQSMRLMFLDGMLACQDKPYATAVHCRM